MQNKKVIRLTESELHNLIKESVNNILNEYYKQDEIDASWDAFEKTRQPKSRYSIKGNLDTYLDDENSWYEFGKDLHDEVMNDDGKYEDKMDDFLDDYHQFSKENDGFNGMQAQRKEPRYKSLYQDKYDKNINKRNLENYI